MSRFIISDHIYIIYTYGSNKNIFGKNLTIYNNIIYCLYVSNYIVCYVIYKIENDDGVIDLNYSANYRKIFMQKLENKFKINIIKFYGIYEKNFAGRLPKKSIIQ